MMSRKEIDRVIDLEINQADQKYGPFTSSHEGLGVLLEELRELESAIHANKSESIRTEAMQIAAVATRLAYAMTDEACLVRSGCKRAPP